MSDEPEEDAAIIGLYDWLAKQPDLERAIADLTSRSLRDLNGYLTRQGTDSGIPGMIWGLVIVESCDRFMKLIPPDETGGLE